MMSDKPAFNAAEFALWVKARRKERGINGSEFARRVGISRSYLGFLERAAVLKHTGKTARPALEIVEAMGLAFKIDINEARVMAGYLPFNQFENIPVTPFVEQVKQALIEIIMPTGRAKDVI